MISDTAVMSNECVVIEDAILADFCVRADHCSRQHHCSGADAAIGRDPNRRMDQSGRGKPQGASPLKTSSASVIIADRHGEMVESLPAQRLKIRRRTGDPDTARNYTHTRRIIVDKDDLLKIVQRVCNIGHRSPMASRAPQNQPAHSFENTVYYITERSRTVSDSARISKENPPSSVDAQCGPQRGTREASLRGHRAARVLQLDVGASVALAV